jgi:hypothetical protein
MIGAAAKAALAMAHKGHKVVVVLVDDMWHPPADFLADLRISASQQRAIEQEVTRQVRLADLVVAGTPPLEAIARTMNAHVVHVPYAAPPVNQWPNIDPKLGHVRRIGWVGARGDREADFAELRDAFERLKGVELVFWGDAPSWVPANAELRPHELIEMPAYYRRLSALPTRYRRRTDRADAPQPFPLAREVH